MEKSPPRRSTEIAYFLQDEPQLSGVSWYNVILHDSNAVPPLWHTSERPTMQIRKLLTATNTILPFSVLVSLGDWIPGSGVVAMGKQSEDENR